MREGGGVMDAAVALSRGDIEQCQWLADRIEAA